MHLKEVHIRCSSLRSMYAFYRNQMGMHCGLTKERLVVDAGTSKLIFMPKKNFYGGYHYAFAIPERAMDAALLFLKKQTSLFYSYDDDSYVAVFRKWKARSVFFSDADGNVVEMIARQGEGAFDGEIFTSEAILGLAEMGLGCSDPRLLSMKLRADAALELFDKGSDSFKAVGNKDGLFILSSPERNWYPSTLPTKLLETTVLFENFGRDYWLRHEADKTSVSEIQRG